ncbi:MAG TPA: LytTR family DNA-binding domain-containing protein [Gemmatimonadaceae bacterium]|nr:LytTR family DNA-binding domain-containing protein [Gemmatimonadaceae bacterium]
MSRGTRTARTPTARTWLVCFCGAGLLGLTMAWQRWVAWRDPEKPPFWDAEYLQPAMIPWYAWALIAPILVFVLDQVASAEMTKRRRIVRYAALAVLVIALHTVASSFALGWWWSFPNPIPVDPGWHIMDQLRNRAMVSVLVVWVIVATYYATRQASPPPPIIALPGPAAAIPSAAPDPSPVIAAGPIALKSADRVWLVDPGDIAWVEADGDYVVVHTAQKQQRIREPISALEQRLPGQFVRISRSAIVNLSAIREVQRWFRGNFVVILRDGTKVTTGARYRDRLAKRIPL